MQRGANSFKKVVSSQNSHYFSLEKTPEWFADKFGIFITSICFAHEINGSISPQMMGASKLQFFWHALLAPPPPDCGALYARVLNYARPLLLKQLEL
jgi:hypothetical protein